MHPRSTIACSLLVRLVSVQKYMMPVWDREMACPKRKSGKLKIPDIGIERMTHNESGDIVGGISGSTYLSSLEIEVLWVREDYRGQNIASKLLEKIEAEAKRLDANLSILLLILSKLRNFTRSVVLLFVVK